MVVRTEMRQEWTKRGMRVATKKGGRTGECAQQMVAVVVVIEEEAAFAIIVKARKRMKARKRFLTALQGVVIYKTAFICPTYVIDETAETGV